MACFLVPATEAIVTTVVEKVIKSKEKKNGAAESGSTGKKPGAGFSAKLSWLNKLLWGGSALLAFEHVWHGEVVPFFPFLTAVKNGETSEMLAEMGSTGVLMAGLVTGAWVLMLIGSGIVEKRAEKKTELVDEVKV